MARRLGVTWSYAHPSQIWDEVRALWPAVRGINWERLEREGWCQYPCVLNDCVGEDVLFSERCDTHDGLAKLVPVELIGPAKSTDASYPYVLITGRMLEHWHTGVMTRRSRVLDELEPDAFVCINGEDLTLLGATIGDEVCVTSRRGTVTAKAQLDDGLPMGTIFMPFCYAEAAANILTNAALDPESKVRNTNTPRSKSSVLTRGTDRRSPTLI